MNRISFWFIYDDSLVAKLSIYLFSCKESNSNISDYEIGLAQIAAASILKINCIFYLQKRATTGASFLWFKKTIY
jgi:hypothetical protein